MVRQLRRFARDLRVRQKFQTSSEWLRWFRVAHVQRLTRGFSHPGRAVAFRVARLSEPVLIRPGTHDFLVFSGILLEDEYGFVEALPLPRSPRILDLGANIGVFTRYVAGTRPDARVIAVEPSSSNYDLLLANVACLGERVSPVRAAVGSDRGVAHLDASGGSWGIRVVSSGVGDPVDVITIDDLMQAHSWTDIDLLKCDIEGGEVELLSGGPDWLRRIRHLAIEVHEPYSLSRLEADLRAAGLVWTRTLSAAGDRTALYSFGLHQP